jgi:putative ubiquitin-RnfH superfamily antitoxin RatB of RatAB toxin-antitoxin module
VIRIEAVYALPEYQYEVTLELEQRARVADALQVLAGHEGFADLDLETMPVGIYGETVSRTRLLEDGDRLELYRSLQVDPMTARRQRAEQQASTKRKPRR